MGQKAVWKIAVEHIGKTLIYSDPERTAIKVFAPGIEKYYLTYKLCVYEDERWSPYGDTKTIEGSAFWGNWASDDVYYLESPEKGPLAKGIYCIEILLEYRYLKSIGAWIGFSYYTPVTIQFEIDSNGDLKILSEAKYIPENQFES